MLWYFEREPFGALWAEEKKRNSYYGFSVEMIRRWGPPNKDQAMKRAGFPRRLSPSR
jgi:hypothetical protein